MGIAGYTKEADKKNSSICIKIKQKEPVPDDVSLTIDGSSKVVPAGKTNYRASLSATLPYDKDTYKVDFQHKIYRSDSYDLSRSISYTIKNSAASSNVADVSATLSNAKNEEIYYHRNVSIKVNPGEEKTVCETLSWNPQQITFQTIEGTIQDSAIADVNGNRTSKACVKVSRENPTIINVSEHSTVTINAVSANNANNTRAGTASIKRANGVKDYTATFTHKLSVPETITDSSVAFTIYLIRNGDTSKPEAISSGSIGFSSAKSQQLLLSNSAPNTQTISVTGNTTASVCEYVVYTPTSILKGDDGSSVGGSGGSVTTHMVCAEVTPPDPVPAKITATTTAKQSYNLGLSNGTGTFHFTHKFYNDNSIGVPLSTTYIIHATVTTKVDTETGDIRQTTNTYTRSAQSSGAFSGQAAIPGTLRSNIPANTSDVRQNLPTIDQFTYSVPQGSTVQICEYIEFTFSDFMVTDNSVSGSGTGFSEEKCTTITRPTLVWEQDDEFELEGKTNHVFSGDTNKLFPESGNERLIGSTTNVSMLFSHMLIFPYKENRTSVSGIQYNYGDETKTARSIQFYLGISTSLNPGERLSLPIDNGSLIPNRIGLPDIGVGKTEKTCRNLFFTPSKFLVKHAYLSLHGRKLSTAVQQTIQEPVTDSIGSSDTVCASVSRPYNFHIKEDSISNSDLEQVVYSGNRIDTSVYSFQVEKSHDKTSGNDWSNFYITGIPNASIQLLAITIDEENFEETPEFHIIGKGQSSSLEPCDYYSQALTAIGLESKYTCGIIEQKSAGDGYTIGKGTGSVGNSVPFYKDSDLIDNSYYEHQYRSQSYIVGKYTGDSVEPLDVGDKFCIALAVSPFDSGKGTV